MANLLVICNTTPAMDARLEEKFTIHRTSALPDLGAWLAHHGASVDYALTDGHLGVPQDIFDALPNLRAISSYGVGYDGVDVDAAVARGIPVAHTPDVLNDEVATTALMLLIACFRGFNANEAHARSGRWSTDGSAPLTRSVDHRTIGILGLGRIGKTIAAKLAPFHPKILYHGRSAQDVPFEYVADLTEMARRSDALICIVPGGVGTRNMIDKPVLEALGPQGVLINVGRGTTVDEDALIAALSSGRLGWAGLDVFSDEPNIPDALRHLPNTVLLPHVGSATVETRTAMGALAVDNLIEHLSTGQMKTPVPECRHLFD